MPQLPQEVSRTGLTIRKKSAALLQVINVYSPKNTYDAVFLSNYATINIIDALARINGVGQVIAVRAARLFVAGLARPRPADRAQPDAERHHRGGAEPEHPGGARPGRRGADLASDQQVQITIKTKGRLSRPEEFEAIVAARQSRRLGGPAEGRRPRRDGRKIPGPLQPLQRRAGRRARHLSDAGLQRGRRDPPACATPWTTLATRFPETSPITCSSIPRCSSPRPSRRSFARWPRPSSWWRWWCSCFSASCARRSFPLVAVPVSIIGTFAVMLAHRLFGQYRLPAGARARDRHRGR